MKLPVSLSLFLGIVLFASLEALVFRSGLYQRALHPNSSSGVFWNSVKFEKIRPSSGLKEVLVVGDSRIAEGFSASRGDQLLKSLGFKFINGGVSGSTLRNWYHYLREVDPNASRYAAIVLPFESYSDRDTGEQGESRYFLDLQIMAPVLRLSDIPTLIADIDPPISKVRAFQELLFKGLIYRKDLIDFLADPRLRRKLVRERNGVADGFAYGYEGQSLSLAGLSADPSTQQLKSHLILSEAVISGLENRIKKPVVEKNGYLARYRKKWLGKILARYANSSTRIVTVRIPVNPFAKILPRAPVEVGFISEVAAQRLVTALPEDYFYDLERGDFFFDYLHLNHDGQQRFTAGLVKQISEVMGVASGAGKSAISHH